MPNNLCTEVYSMVKPLNLAIAEPSVLPERCIVQNALGDVSYELKSFATIVRIYSMRYLGTFLRPAQASHWWWYSLFLNFGTASSSLVPRGSRIRTSRHRALGARARNLPTWGTEVVYQASSVGSEELQYQHGRECE